MNVSPYRITPEDLEGLDHKTIEGMQPLLDALNETLSQLVAAVAVSTEAIIPVTLAVGASVADSFPLVFRHSLTSTPRWVGMVCNPRDPDHSLTTPFAMQGFGLTDAGLISVPWITGLLASHSYDLTFLVK